MSKFLYINVHLIRTTGFFDSQHLYKHVALIHSFTLKFDNTNNKRCYCKIDLRILIFNTPGSNNINKTRKIRLEYTQINTSWIRLSMLICNIFIKVTTQLYICITVIISINTILIIEYYQHPLKWLNKVLERLNLFYQILFVYYIVFVKNVIIKIILMSVAYSAYVFIT